MAVPLTMRRVKSDVMGTSVSTHTHTSTSPPLSPTLGVKLEILIAGEKQKMS